MNKYVIAQISNNPNTRGWQRHFQLANNRGLHTKNNDRTIDVMEYYTNEIFKPQIGSYTFSLILVIE